MASAEEVGKGIVEASRFLQKAHKQLGELIRLVDRGFKNSGWVTRKSGDIDGHLGNELGNPRTWLLQTASRTYAPLDGGNTGLAVLVALEWPKLEQAMVYVAAVRFKEQVSADVVWARWKTGIELLNVMGRGAPASPRALPPAVLEEWTDALAAHAFGVPLCELGEENLMARLVTPAVELAAVVAAAPLPVAA